MAAQARVLTNADQLDRAQVELKAARDLDPHASGLATLDTALADRKTRKMNAAAAAAAAALVTSSKPEPQDDVVTESGFTVQQRREMADLYRRGVEAMETGQKDQAVHLWEVVWSMDPDFQSVTEYLAQNYLARGMEHVVAGNLPDAVTNWEVAVRVDPNDPKALGYLQRAREQTDRMKMMDN